MPRPAFTRFNASVIRVARRAESGEPGMQYHKLLAYDAVQAGVLAPDEVEDAKKYLLGSLPFRFTTGAAVAEQLLQIDRYRLGFAYLDDYRKAVACRNKWRPRRDGAPKHASLTAQVMAAQPWKGAP